MEQADARDHGGIDGSVDYEGETFATVTTPAITSDSATSGVQATTMTMEDGDGVELFGRGSEWNLDFLLAMSTSLGGSTRAAVPSPTALGDGDMQLDTTSASAQGNGFFPPVKQKYTLMISKVPRGRASSSWGHILNSYEADEVDVAFLPPDREVPSSTSRNERKPRSAEGQRVHNASKKSNRRATRTKADCEDSSEPLRESAGPLGLVVPGMRTVLGSEDNEGASSAMSVVALGASTHSPGASDEAMADLDDGGAHLRGTETKDGSVSRLLGNGDQCRSAEALHRRRAARSAKRKATKDGVL